MVSCPAAPLPALPAGATPLSVVHTTLGLALRYLSCVSGHPDCAKRAPFAETGASILHTAARSSGEYCAGVYAFPPDCALEPVEREIRAAVDLYGSTAPAPVQEFVCAPDSFVKAQGGGSWGCLRFYIARVGGQAVFFNVYSKGGSVQVMVNVM